VISTGVRLVILMNVIVSLLMGKGLGVLYLWIVSMVERTAHDISVFHYYS